ncbi:hypothetical protein KZZ52_51400 [Dactylosporangium sp. AC04546]|uniref:hypothetical protein n=1 Tax=Dactylosporangium sp. AC04546 TaxID=2862460 RepID=UPI001EDEDE82|nr:hypothetical protein [Dactylosporangium sp. AC04546]WVK82270.1 hypothetical protein KZZ52_51400 [Dactylosporangium sp. AC04546]
MPVTRWYDQQEWPVRSHPFAPSGPVAPTASIPAGSGKSSSDDGTLGSSKKSNAICPLSARHA